MAISVKVCDQQSSEMPKLSKVCRVPKHVAFCAMKVPVNSSHDAVLGSAKPANAEQLSKTLSSTCAMTESSHWELVWLVCANAYAQLA